MENPNTPENRNINRGGGNYIENLGHDYVQGDKHVYISNYGHDSDKKGYSNKQKILHIILTPQDNDYVSLRYFWENDAKYKERRLSVAEIERLSDRAETEYYTRLPANYATTGQALYNWLDKNDRLLAAALQQPHSQGLVIAIDTGKGLANLPWELLHDGKQFLVEKTPPIIPLRWVSNGKPIANASSPQNRPLNVLFMATSPIGVAPELDYEAEEGRILEATKRVPLNLRVEESGCLDELGYVVREYETGYFDVVHLMGHASYNYGSPYFLTEDEYGQRVDSNASKIANTLRSPLPRLIFLSGCRTGYSSDDAVPSMAEELLNMGATAVLGWGQRVGDTYATATASIFYQELSQGRKVTEAISSTYKALLKQQIPDWHKLRLYVGNILPQELVTPLRTPGRKQLSKPSITLEFLDDEKRLRVVTRENFVGRRRQLQNCLRILKTDNSKVGVLIHGMGGSGKSSIASRLWERLSEHEKILWWRQIDEPSLINKLKKKLTDPQLRNLTNDLENSQDELEIRLISLFRQLSELGEKPFLFILDDFEWNLEHREGGYIISDKAAPILEALVSAIQETGTNHRIIITCRYDFDSDLLRESFYKQGLEPLRGSELTKKLNRLEHFSSDKLPQNLRERALILADGNPRLLEFINNEVLGKKDVEVKLTELEQSPELWKDKIIWEELYQLIDEPLQKILSYCLVYKIPVPMEALEIVCDRLPKYQEELKRGINLGLIDVSSEVEEENRVYRISRILPRIIPVIQLPEGTELYSLYERAAEELYELWGKKESESRKNLWDSYLKEKYKDKRVYQLWLWQAKADETKEKWQEIFRLKFANRGNPERFREGFHNMLAVQLDSESQQVFESELRKVAGDLVDLELYTLLEHYLKQQQWEEANLETIWIFYQVMVKEKYKHWQDLIKYFPCKILTEINRLWIDNTSNKSSDKSGICLQTEINTSWLKEEVDSWERFGICGGYYYNLPFSGCWVKAVTLGLGLWGSGSGIHYSDFMERFITCEIKYF